MRSVKDVARRHRHGDDASGHPHAGLQRRSRRVRRRPWTVVAVAGVLAVLATPAAGSVPDAHRRPTAAPTPVNPVSFQVITPSVVNAGQPFDVVVRAVGDPFEETVTGYRGRISLGAYYGEPRIRPTSYRFRASDRGTATIRVTLFTAGSSGVGVGGDGATGSAQLWVEAARPAALAVDVRPQVSAGVTDQVTVRAVDAWGNTAPWDRPISLRVSDPGPGAGVQPPTVLPDGAARTVLRPPSEGVTFVTPGDRTITATSRGLRPGVARVHVLPYGPPGPQLYRWGFEYLTFSNLTPVHVPGQWRSVSSGGCQWTGIRTDGSLWLWGIEPCWDETGLSTLRPVGSTSDWVAADTGDSILAALRADGSLWLGGQNAGGAVSPSVTEPELVASEPGWVAVSSADRTYLIGVDGSLWVVLPNLWGAPPELTRLGERTDWVHVSTSGRHVVALTADGAAWEWTHNGPALPGGDDVTPPTPDVPVRVPGGTRWRTVAAGGSHTLAVAQDGTLWSWGANDHGQLGDGSSTDRTVPARVADATWRSVAAGADFSLAVRDDGTLWSWGGNGSGQLGDGTDEPRSVPGRVDDGTGWLSVAADGRMAMALAGG